jgi:hypothetical protein
MSPDAGGYLRLRRALIFIGQELRETDETDSAERVERAIAFFSGSPSEFLGESLIALEGVLGRPAPLAPSMRAFVSALAAEIREGFDRIGGA